MIKYVWEVSGQAGRKSKVDQGSWGMETEVQYIISSTFTFGVSYN